MGAFFQSQCLIYVCKTSLRINLVIILLLVCVSLLQTKEKTRQLVLETDDISIILSIIAHANKSGHFDSGVSLIVYIFRFRMLQMLRTEIVRSRRQSSVSYIIAHLNDLKHLNILHLPNGSKQTRCYNTDRNLYWVYIGVELLLQSANSLV